MRRPRLKAPAFLPVAYYHCVSRVVNREFVFGEEEKDKLVEYMWKKLPVPLKRKLP